MRLTKRQKISAAVALLLLAMVVLLLTVSWKSDVNVTFVRYEDDGQLVILRYKNNTKAEVRYVMKDNLWQFSPRFKVFRTSNETGELRVKYVGTPTEAPSKLEIASGLRATGIRLRFEHLIKRATGLTFDRDLEWLPISVELPAVTNARNN